MQGTVSLRGRSLNPPRTRAAHSKRACRRAASKPNALAEAGDKTGGTDGASSAECASGTGKRGTASPRGQFLFSSAVCAASPADTSGARQAAYRRAAGETENPAEAGRPAAWTAYLLPNARAASVCGELHCCAVSFVFKRGVLLHLPRTRAAPASVELHCRAVSFIFKRGVR